MFGVFLSHRPEWQDPQRPYSRFENEAEDFPETNDNENDHDNDNDNSVDPENQDVSLGFRLIIWVVLLTKLPLCLFFI